MAWGLSPPCIQRGGDTWPNGDPSTQEFMGFRTFLGSNMSVGGILRNTAFSLGLGSVAQPARGEKRFMEGPMAPRG